MSAYAEHAADGLACLWTATPAGRVTHVLPDACVDVIWSSASGPFVAGPDTRAYRHVPAPGERLLGARFAPGTGAAALGVPLAELRDRRVPLHALLPVLAGELSPDRPATDVEALLRGLGRARPAVNVRSPSSDDAERPFTAEGGRRGADADAVAAAAARLLRTPGVRVPEVAATIGVSERTLRRRLEHAVGYGPKLLQRVLRLQGLLRAAERTDPRGDLLRLALDAGYSHQSHLTQDCVRLTGLTPVALLRERGAYAAAGR